jgi:thioredoxin 1
MLGELREGMARNSEPGTPTSDPAARLVRINEDNFEEVVSGHQVVVTEFTAAWCGPCRRMKTMLVEEVIPNIPAGADVVVAQIDLDESPRIAEVMGIEVVPTVLFFIQGSVAVYVTEEEEARGIPEDDDGGDLSNAIRVVGANPRNGQEILKVVQFLLTAEPDEDGIMSLDAGEADEQ